MDAIGPSVVPGPVVLLVPLLAVLVAGWLVVKLLEFGRRQVVRTTRLLPVAVTHILERLAPT